MLSWYEVGKVSPHHGLVTGPREAHGPVIENRGLPKHRRWGEEKWANARRRQHQWAGVRVGLRIGGVGPRSAGVRSLQDEDGTAAPISLGTSGGEGPSASHLLPFFPRSSSDLPGGSPGGGPSSRGALLVCGPCLLLQRLCQPVLGRALGLRCCAALVRVCRPPRDPRQAARSLRGHRPGRRALQTLASRLGRESGGRGSRPVLWVPGDVPRDTQLTRGTALRLLLS